MKQISVTVAPWMYDRSRVELRVRLEIGAKTFDDTRIIALGDFDSVFDYCLQAAGEALKRLAKTEMTQEPD